MEIGLIVGLGLIMLGFVYYGVGAWLRDREQTRRHREQQSEGGRPGGGQASGERGDHHQHHDH